MKGNIQIMQKKFFSLFLIASAFLAFFVFSPKASLHAAQKNINVVTTLDFYGEAAKAVLGDHGKVTSIINSPNVDPHDYEATPKTAKTVSKADLVVYNGAGYDNWVKKLKGKKYLSVASFMKVKEGQNEHLWYNPETMEKLADHLATEYGKLQPENKAEFKRNATKYKKSLNKLTQTLDKIKQNSNNQKVAVSEPIFDYSLEKMGYKISNTHFAKATEEGSDPSYSDIKKLQNDIKNKKIAFFVQNTQSESSVIKNIVSLCKENNVPVVKVTETLPKDKTYVSWLLSEYQEVFATQK